MRVCHTIEAVFDDPNLVAFGGLSAVMMRVAERWSPRNDRAARPDNLARPEPESHPNPISSSYPSRVGGSRLNTPPASSTLTNSDLQ
jgi:hypothetical protein